MRAVAPLTHSHLPQTGADSRNIIDPQRMAVTLANANHGELESGEHDGHR